MHKDWPVYGLKLPAAQEKQTVAPVDGLYVPTPHAAHEDEPSAAANRPAAHAEHALGTDWPAVGLYLPASQATQEAGWAEKWPAGHVVAV